MTILNIHDGANILIVCHDAGGAEVVSSWVRRNPEFNYTYFLTGPAINIFNRKLGSVISHSSKPLLSILLDSAEIVLTSTSWASDIEKRALQMAADNSVYSIAFLDHWCNYLVRFQDGENQITPNEIWVGDRKAYDLAVECFENIQIKLVDNPYFLDIADEFSKVEERLKPSPSLHILYVCEAISESGRVSATGESIEFLSMNLFFEHLNTICKEGKPVTVKLRLHPAEEAGKYNQYLFGNDEFQVEVATGATLVEDCTWADCVVGMNSMALIIAKVGGKDTYYCNLNGAAPINLPTEGLMNFLEASRIES